MQSVSLDDNLGFKINKANAALKSLFSRYLLDAGGVFTPEQWGTIQFVISNPGVKQAEIVKTVRCDQTTMIRMLDVMQRKELIRREPDPSDRRAFRIYATDAAIKAYRAAIPFVKKYNDALEKIVSGNEYAAMIKTLDRIISDVSAI